MTSEPMRLGVAGLGRAFVLMLPTFRNDPRVKLVAAAAPRAESRSAFESEFGARGYASVEEMAAEPRVGGKFRVERSGQQVALLHCYRAFVF